VLALGLDAFPSHGHWVTFSTEKGDGPLKRTI